MAGKPQHKERRARVCGGTTRFAMHGSIWGQLVRGWPRSYSLRTEAAPISLWFRSKEIDPRYRCMTVMIVETTIKQVDNAWGSWVCKGMDGQIKLHTYIGRGWHQLKRREADAASSNCGKQGLSLDQTQCILSTTTPSFLE